MRTKVQDKLLNPVFEEAAAFWGAVWGLFYPQIHRNLCFNAVLGISRAGKQPVGKSDKVSYPKGKKGAELGSDAASILHP